MIDEQEGFWLRRDARLYWSQAGCVIASIGSFPWLILVGRLWGRHPTSDVQGTLLVHLPLGVILPFFVGGIAWTLWADIRTDGWFVGPKGIEVWELGAIRQTFPWTKIRAIDPWTQDRVRIRLLDTPEEPSLGFQRREAILLCREYARERVAERPPVPHDWF